MTGTLQSGRALVTGGAGFIGSHLVEALVEAGAAVTVIDNLNAGLRSNLRKVEDRVEFCHGDVRDRATMQGLIERVKPAHIFHLAANASVPGSAKDPQYDFETNCGGTFVLLDTLRLATQKPRVVLASSGAVYGEPREFPMTETSPLTPISPYGAGKVGAEALGRVFAVVYGIPIVIARIFNTYGPRMPRFVVLDFLKKLRDTPERLEILGSGLQVRDFCFVSDTVRALLLLSAAGEAGEAYNVASGKATSVMALAEAIVRLRRGNGPTELICSGSSWPGDAQRWEVDISKMQALGYHPGIDLDTGLRRVMDWFEKSES